LTQKKESKIGQNNPQNRRSLEFRTASYKQEAVMYYVSALSVYSSGINPISGFFSVNPIATAQFPSFIDPNIPSSRPYSYSEEPVFVLTKPVTWVRPLIDQVYSAAIQFDRAFSFPVANGFKMNPEMRPIIEAADESIGFPVGPLTQLFVEMLGMDGKSLDAVPPTLLQFMRETSPEDDGLSFVLETEKELKQKLDQLRSLQGKNPSDTAVQADIERCLESIAKNNQIKAAILQLDKGDAPPTVRHAQEM